MRRMFQLMDPKEHYSSTLKRVCFPRLVCVVFVVCRNCFSVLLPNLCFPGLPLNRWTETSEKLINGAAHESRGTSHDITCCSQPLKLRATAPGQPIL